MRLLLTLGLVACAPTAVLPTPTAASAMPSISRSPTDPGPPPTPSGQPTGYTSFAQIQSYDVLDDGQTLVLAINIGRLTSIGYVATDEDASSVRLRVLLGHHPGTATADLVRIDLRTYLESPLGSRTVLDQDGRVIPRRPR